MPPVRPSLGRFDIRIPVRRGACGDIAQPSRCVPAGALLAGCAVQSTEKADVAPSAGPETKHAIRSADAALDMLEPFLVPACIAVSSGAPMTPEIRSRGERMVIGAGPLNA